jgi:hypothetical protein
MYIIDTSKQVTNRRIKMISHVEARINTSKPSIARAKSAQKKEAFLQEVFDKTGWRPSNTLSVKAIKKALEWH